jgi:hypothetical protein
VERSLHRSLPIISTAHAAAHLTSKLEEGEAFTAVYALDTYQSTMLEIKTTQQPYMPTIKTPAIKVTAMPGRHVSLDVSTSLNAFNQAVGFPPAVDSSHSNAERYHRSLVGRSNSVTFPSPPLLPMPSSADTASTSQVTPC